jgi:hypothetical protein
MVNVFKIKTYIKTIVLFIFIVVILNITACSKIDNKKIDQNILKTVEEIEKSAYKLNTVKISYDEYIQRTDKYLSKYFTSFYKVQLIFYANDSIYVTGKHLQEKDYKGMSLDDLKQKVEPALQVISAQLPSYFYVSYGVSKVFDDNSNSQTSMHYKSIFIKHIHQIDNKEYTLYKQYKFKREGNEYVLFSINDLVNYRDKDLLYGNEKVEFTESINIE